MPTEELVDNGFAVLSFCYQDVASDDGDFTNGLAGLLFPDGNRGPSDPGKIALWAWAAHRVMDWAETRTDALDLTQGVVCGHSRLGKTALLAAATDPRFAYAYSNDSGCSGAALARGTRGETVRDICQKFPFWFCENYLQYVDNENSLPFDQHDLIAAIAPRRVLIGSASEDTWADPLGTARLCRGIACVPLRLQQSRPSRTGRRSVSRWRRGLSSAPRPALFQPRGLASADPLR